MADIPNDENFSAACHEHGRALIAELERRGITSGVDAVTILMGAAANMLAGMAEELTAPASVVFRRAADTFEKQLIEHEAHRALSGG